MRLIMPTFSNRAVQRYRDRAQQIVDSAVASALKEFAPGNLRSNQLAVTLIDLRETARPRIATSPVIPPRAFPFWIRCSDSS